METKLDLYVELLNALNSSELDYEQDDSQKMVIVQALYNADLWHTVEVYKDYYIGGTIEFDNSNNFYRYSNLGCPEFNDVYDAIEWMVEK
jgi:hypothetical protein